MWNKFYRAFVTNGGYKTVLSGLGNTVEIAIFGFLIGLAIGTIIAAVKINANRSKFAFYLSKIGDVYVGFFRGTPIIVQLLIFYYVLFPLLGISVDKLIVAIVTYGLNSAAYVSEIMRSGILSVDIGQMEAGSSLGLKYRSTMLRIVLPQAIKNVVPTLGNEIIALLKDTSVVSFIAIVDLTKAFQLIGSSTYEYIVPYIILAAIYLVIILGVTGIIKLFEKRLRKNERR